MANTLSRSYVQSLVNNYRNNHWSLVNNFVVQQQGNANAQDARSVWFSLDQLKSFISDIEATTVQGDLGVRIYFGEYAQNQQASAPEAPQLVGMHTVAMVPTICVPGGDGFNHDFDPTTGSSNFGQMNTMCALNHGSLIPPPFPQGGVVPNVGQDFMIFCDQNP